MTAVARVYEFHYGEGYEWLLPIDEEDIDRLLFDGQPRAQSWRPVRMRRLKISSARRPLVLGDFQACSGGDMLMLGRRAKDTIGSYLEQYGELLPLRCRDGEFWTLNVTTVVDALDEDRSELRRASDDGTILWIDRHEFRRSALGSAEIFKLRQMVHSAIYVTEPFVRLIEETGLKGLEFTQVWEGQ